MQGVTERMHKFFVVVVVVVVVGTVFIEQSDLMISNQDVIQF